jgi:hypothetical protein
MAKYRPSLGTRAMEDPVEVLGVGFWLLIARHSASLERTANDQVIRSLDY